jgi:hypothetical protein
MKDETRELETYSRFPTTHARRGMATMQGLKLSKGTQNLIATKWYQNRDYKPVAPYRRNHTPIGDE